MSEATVPDAAHPGKKRLAIIGCGSSGLITLKMAKEYLPDWELVAFEKSGSITGCWGNPYPGFVSTSTKYTTQFACFPEFSASVTADGPSAKHEFFREDEYGAYLERFADVFELRTHIELNCTVDRVEPEADGCWKVSFRRDSEQVASTTEFDAVVFCSGLAAQPKPVATDKPSVPAETLCSPVGLESITQKCIVVIGGGESAVDYARRLSHPSLENRVFLSLKSGVRVSPRYHPIRRVPSDFLRNRLMLSIHESLRNWIGQRFVELRIKYASAFERFFPAAADQSAGTPLSEEVRARRKLWDMRLTAAAKDDLFNMFHNKSDDFLDAVGEERIQIVGEALDESLSSFKAFQSNEVVQVDADLVVPAIGYESSLPKFTQLQPADFYLGCIHHRLPHAYLIGFARPIIGNIPSISEMQARLVCGQISGKFPRPADIQVLHERDQAQRRQRFKSLCLDGMYPVEMFPYCDQLARMMGIYPTISRIGSWWSWLRMQLEPASTLHYFAQSANNDSKEDAAKRAPIYMPSTLILLLIALLPLSWLMRLVRR